MKITHVISDSNVGGAGILLSSITNALRSSFDMEIILPQGSALIPRLSNTGAKIIELDMSADKSFRPHDARSFYRFFKNHKTDLLHTHAALSARLGGALAGIRPCISTRHCATDANKVQKKSHLQRNIYNYCTDLTVSTADFATENLVNEGISKDKIVTIKNGVARAERTSRSERHELKRSLGIPKGATVIGCCARLERVKGQDTLLYAAARLIPKIPNIYLLFVGDGSFAEEYRTLAARLGILERAKFVGYVSNPSAYQNIFDINVNASRGTETSCLVSSECMSLGIPTVASDFGGNREMIHNEKNGLVFPTDSSFALAETLERLIKDKALYDRLSCGANEIYEKHFSLERMAKEYERMYHEAKMHNRHSRHEKQKD